MKLHKLSGAGNDFLAWVEEDPAGDQVLAPPSRPTVEQIVAWCRRGVSIGADGFLVLRRIGQTGEGVVRVIHRDADGSRPELCLNGARCAVELAASLGWTRDNQVRLVTDVGEVEGVSVERGRSRVTVPGVLIDPPRRLSLEVEGSRYDGHLVRVGGPHFVLDWPQDLNDTDLDLAPVLTLGAALRRHPDLGPAGSNVHFVDVGRGAAGAIQIRSFERGVEGETLACGTGSLAAALVAEQEGVLSLDPQIEVQTRGGFRLGVGRDQEGRLTLEGDARRVAVVEVLEGAGYG